MDLKNQHIFIFSMLRHDSPLASTNYTIAKFLAKENKVYFIDMPFTLIDYFKLKKTAQFDNRRKGFFSGKHSIIATDNPYLKIVITPPVPSINFLPEGKMYRSALRMNERIAATRINNIIKDQHIKDFIFINSFNFYYPTITSLIKPTLSVYHSVDPLIKDYEIKHGLISEELAVKNADLVFCTSKELYRSKKLVNDNTFFIPNAADIVHSQKALDEKLPVHAMFKKIKKPVIGYFGNIERRMDFPLLKEVFDKNKDKSFVFVGPSDKEYLPEWFDKVPNLYLPGSALYDEMPSILKGFDVAIIPFKKDEGSNKIFPLKLFEYMGAGKPVVSTNFNPDLEDFTKNLVAYCTNAAEFTDSLNKALNDDSGDKQKRLDIAAENTWEHRMDEFGHLLDINLRRKLAERTNVVKA